MSVYGLGNLSDFSDHSDPKKLVVKWYRYIDYCEPQFKEHEKRSFTDKEREIMARLLEKMSDCPALEHIPSEYLLPITAALVTSVFSALGGSNR